jgi:peroxiredoxin
MFDSQWIRKSVCGPVLLLCLACPSNAGEFNQVLSIGDAIPQWTDLIGVDDAKHSTDDLRDQKVLVIAFTCNSCPYAVDVEDRLIALHSKYSEQGVSVVAINVNKVEDDLLEAMKERAEEKQFPFSYLFDESQKIAKDFGALRTPEFFVVGSDRKIAYMGALDDSPNGSKVTATYVADAVDALLAGKAIAESETVPIGCLIRFERERRSRRAKTRATSE